MRGSSLVEMVVSLAIMLVVVAAILVLVSPAHGTFATQNELLDVQQRLRTAADAIARDVLIAGAGSRGYFASITPHRRGTRSADSPGAFFTDRISVVFVPPRAPQTTVSSPTGDPGSVLATPQPGCPAGSPLCGFRANMLVAVFDETGAYDTIRLSNVTIDPPALAYDGPALSKSYAAGARIAQVETTTYWLRPGSVPQLMKYDGRETDVPLADNIAALHIDYFADADLADPSNPFTQLGVDHLTDGPWRPDAVAPNRFDADLLRVRRVRVRMRVRANRSILGTPIADQDITIEIAPRNQNLIQ
jgi:hypothetical protein